MKIHEYQAKGLFEKEGIPTPPGRLAISLEEAREAGKEIGFPAVLKSQVLAGGRGLAGGIKIVQRPEEFEKTFLELKKLKIKGYQAERILITHACSIKQEFYAAIALDNAKGDVVVIASAAGGIDIEETAQKNPEKIHKYYLEGKKKIGYSRWAGFIEKIFKDKNLQGQGTAIFESLLKVFFKNDCSLAEINPLILDDKHRLVAIDAKIILDDNALFKHPETAGLRDLKYEDKDELEARAAGLSFVKLGGNIGCIVNGAGLAMATTDVIKLLGGEPANFLDVGGSSSPEKVLNALRIIFKNPKVKAILINIFGGITRCDDIAEGILAAKTQMDIRVPLVIRLTGTNEKEAVELLSKEKMKIYTSMREAVQEIVKLTKGH